MPNIAPLQPYDEAALAALDPDARLQTRMAGIYAHRPEFAQALGALSVACATAGTLEPRLVELVRLRIAFHNQCRSCMAIRYSDAIEDGLTEPLVCSLERPEEAPDLTAAERSALRFADLFANNHLAIDEGVLDDLRQHFNEGSLQFLDALRAVRRLRADGGDLLHPR